MEAMSAPPPAKVFTAKGLATRARIVAAAAALMFDHGVAATGVEDVQREANVSGSQMYHYFTDKHALVQAVVAYRADRVGGVEKSLGPLDSLPALRAWAAHHVEGQRQNLCVGGCRLGSLVAQVAEADPVARDLLDSGFEAWEQPILDGLQTMADRGELRPDASPGRLAVAAVAALQGGLVLTQVHRSVTPLEDALAVFLDHVACVMTPGVTSPDPDAARKRARAPRRTRSPGGPNPRAS